MQRSRSRRGRSECRCARWLLPCLPARVPECMASWYRGAMPASGHTSVSMPLMTRPQISAGALAAALQKMKDSDDEGDDEDEDLGGGYDADSIYGAEDVSPHFIHFGVVLSSASPLTLSLP